MPKKNTPKTGLARFQVNTRIYSLTHKRPIEKGGTLELDLAQLSPEDLQALERLVDQGLLSPLDDPAPEAPPSETISEGES